MKKLLIFLILVCSLVAGSAPGETNYRVTLAQAAPGQLAALLDEARRYRESHPAVLMRHSQGDFWDLMILEPAGDEPLNGPRFHPLESYRTSFLASSESNWSDVEARNGGAGLYHIEMFHAAAGQFDALLEQRKMENEYLTTTARAGNLLFVTTFGSDVDAFTIGFYRDIAHFAESPDLPAEVFEKAATDAGFASRDDIGLHLRRTISRHQDTLATAVD